MAGRGAALLLLTVLAATLTEDAVSQDLRALEDELKDLLVAVEDVQEVREARDKGKLPEELEASVKRVLKKKGDGEVLKKKGGKDGEKMVKKGENGEKRVKKGEKEEKRVLKKIKKEGKRKEDNEGTKRRRKKGEVRKVCPGGKCVASAEQCGGRTVRSAKCKTGICCVTASKRNEDEEERFKKKNCKTRKPCKNVWGTCVNKKHGCPKSDQVMLLNSKQTKYCGKKSCGCCTDEVPQPACVSKKCAKKKGFCTTDKSECTGKLKIAKSFCSGEGCMCCLPVKDKGCTAKPACEDMGGKCVDLKTGECDTKLLKGKEYCKGKKCGCCVPEDEPFKWGYTAENGPAIWPSKFPTCGAKRQSPVALVSKDAKGTYPWIPFFFENYRETPISQTLINNAHTAMVMLEQKNEPLLSGGDLKGRYKFLQYHFHWGKDESEGSEHTIDGRKFPGEIHLVHWKESYGTVAKALTFEDGLAVLGIMFELSHKDNPYLDPIFDNLDKIIEANTEVKIPPFALSRLLPRNVDDFFRYEGSLTTPTCNEIVRWTVFKDTIKISKRQLAKFRILLDEHKNPLIENFRPVQPLNGREVFMGRESAYWSYVDPFGPKDWPDSFPICGSDVRQSPVALVEKEAVGEFPRVNLGFRNYDQPAKSTVIFNNGHTAQVMFEVEAGKEMTIRGGGLKGKYQVLQFHFHWGSSDALGSEHTINGNRFPLELHIVHWKTSYDSVSDALTREDGLAVLGIMVEISKEDNPTFQPIVDALAKIVDPDAETTLDSFILCNLLPTDTESFYRYDGSLTTPTCNEIVKWTVFTDTITISSKQLAQFRKLRDDGGLPLVNNFRQPLPLNGRKVYLKGKTMQWSYVGATGADNWPNIFDGCKATNKRQSPVDLVTKSASSVSFPPFELTNYNKMPTKVTGINNKHTAQFMFDTANVPSVKGGGLDGDYTFLQFHLHWGKVNERGSEHTIDGKSFPAELHLVHWKTSYGSVAEALKFGDGFAVLGVNLEISTYPNPKLQNIIDSLSNLIEPETETNVTPFVLENVLPNDLSKYFRYLGSLTTPTCNEVVVWTVFKEPIKISESQLEEFRKMQDESGLPLVDNFRPVQNLAGRTIYMT